MSLKEILKDNLRQIGYEVRRTRPPEEIPAVAAPKIIPINVFPLVVRDLIDRKRLQNGSGDEIFFVQIGAHDGLHYDPVRSFVTKYHWRGILVEPQPEIFKRLVANYKDESQLILENIAIDSQDGQATLYAFKKTDELPDHATMLASFNRGALEHNSHNYKGEIEELSVPTLTLTSLLSKYQVNKLDLLQIDTEGHDFRIIQMLAGSHIKPTIIHFENAGMNTEQLYECYELLHGWNYRVLPIGIDTIAYQQQDEDDTFLGIIENKGYD